MSAARAFLVCTPITIVALAAVTVKLAMMPEKSGKPAVVTQDHGALVEMARAKYGKAKAAYGEATRLAPPDDAAKLAEARSLLQSDKDPATIKSFEEAMDLASKDLGAQQIVDYVRDHVDDAIDTRPGEPRKGYEFEDLANNINMLLGMIRKR